MPCSRGLPAWLLILLVAALAWLLHRSIGLALFVVAALLFIMNQGYWAATLETLSLVFVSALFSTLIGVPIGIAAAHRPRLYAALRPVLDLMQTLPTFVYLIPTLVLFGLGVVPGLISTVIFALPAPIRLTHLGISSVPSTLLEAGEAFGATPMQRLWKIELPSALPTILAGITQCIMLCLSMVVIAALVGAGGLGVPVVRALNSVQVDIGFEAGIAIVLLAIILDRVSRPGRGGPQMNAALAFQNVDILFAREQGRKGARAIRDALARLDAGATREEISAACGVVVGVAGRKPRHRAGRDLRDDGALRFRQIDIDAGRQRPEGRHARQRIGRRRAMDRSMSATAAPRKLRRLRRERVAMVFQQFALLPWRTVADNVGLGLELRGEPAAERKRIVAEQLELVGLSHWARPGCRRAVRRHAAARGPCPRVRDEGGHPADGRAVLGARSADPRQAAGRTARPCRQASGRRSCSSATISTRRCSSATASRSCSTAASCRRARRRTSCCVPPTITSPNSCGT